MLLILQQASTGGIKGVVRSTGLDPAGTIVYLIPDHPDSTPASLDTALIDQREIAFHPRLLAVGPRTTVRFRNSDPILHNVFSPPGPGAGFDLGTYPRPDSRDRLFEENGAHVILCHVHPEMVAFVVVVPTPYRAVVDQDGAFAIGEIPSGRYRLRVWRRGAEPFDRSVHITPGRTLEVELELTPARHRR